MGVMLDWCCEVNRADMRRQPLEVARDILNVLEENTGDAMSINEIARLANINLYTAKNYLKMISELQKLPNLEEISAKRGPMFRIPGLSELPEMEQERILKEEYGVELAPLEEVYVNLSRSKAVSKERAMQIPLTKYVAEGIKFQHLKKTEDGKIYLTKIGESIAKGAEGLFKRELSQTTTNQEPVDRVLLHVHTATSETGTGMEGRLPPVLNRGSKPSNRHKPLIAVATPTIELTPEQIKRWR
jgi:predicted transcriptional regulator